MTLPFKHLFNPTQTTKAYQTWRDYKLAMYPLAVNSLAVDIQRSNNITDQEINSIQQNCLKTNMSLYRFRDHDTRNKQSVHKLGTLLGLTGLDKNLCSDDDCLTSLQVTEHKGQHDYIPYTNRKLSWHTDGYYNAPDKQVHATLLHCAQPAMKGGTNLLLDHEIAYILLREENPSYIHALMQPDAMTIPANILNGEIIRPKRSGPVFSVSIQGNLHMRYSARLKNIAWKQDDMTEAAVHFLRTLWESDSPYKIKYRLKAGEGIISNNVLHCRTGFEDSNNPAEKRLLYRGRYFERIINTDTSLLIR